MSKEITIKLTEEQAKIVINALSESMEEGSELLLDEVNIRIGHSNNVRTDIITKLFESIAKKELKAEI